MSGKLEQFFDDFFMNFQKLDQKVIGEDMRSDETRLAKDDKGAWVNHIADQYLNGEQVDMPPEELQINKEDIIRELTKRELEKIFKAQ